MSREELNALKKVDETSAVEKQLKDSQKEEKAIVDVNELTVDQQKYKLLLIINESPDADITLYIYSSYDPFCLASVTSKIILPGQKYLHRDQATFKFDLFAIVKEKQEENAKKQDKRIKKRILEVQKLDKDKLIRIKESLECKEDSLADFPDEKRVCFRKIQREKELMTAAGSLNLYEILGLDMDEIRELDQDSANKAITKAYRKQMKIWHPDKNFGDAEIAIQIITAKEILLDDARRASYHNAVDYDKGWLSPKRWKSIFWPECYTDKQNADFIKRIGMSVVSLGLAVGGVVLTVCTAGTGTPVVVALCGTIFGAGCTVGGSQSLKYAMSKDAVVDGCEAKKWAQEMGKGFTVGGITGGVTAAYLAATAAAEVAINVGDEAATVGFTALRVGVKRIANDVVQTIPGQLIESGRQALTSSAMEFAKERLDDTVENQHPVQHVKRGITSMVSSVAIGTALQTVDTAKKIWKGDMNGNCSKLSNEEKAKRRSRNTQKAIESGTEKIVGESTEFLENRFFDSSKNEHFGNNEPRGNTVDPNLSNEKEAERRIRKLDIGSETGMEGALVFVDDHFGETSLTLFSSENYKRGRNESDESCIQDYKACGKTRGTKVKTEESCSILQSSSRDEQDGNQETSEKDEQIYVYQQRITSEELIETTASSNGKSFEENQELDERGLIKYRSEGDWLSKMIVTFILNGEEFKKKVYGDGTRVHIPAEATDIEVRFRVRRPHWGDLIKYDRFNKTWIEPSEPHVFRYEKPVDRTFTISGNLWYEAVMKVTDEYHEETKEMY